MASPPGQSPITYSQSKVVDPIAQAKWAYLTKGPNAPLNILAKDASYKAQILAGMAKNDPEAQKKFFGHTPTEADWARIKGGTGKTIPNITPTQTAAQGGLMALRGYAPGGKAKVKLPPAPKGETPEQRSKRLMDFENAGGQLNKEQKNFVANYAEYSGNMEKGGYTIDYKTGMPVAPKLPSNATKAQREAANQKFADATGLQVGKNNKVTPIPDWKPPTDTSTQPDNAGTSLAGSLTQAPIGFDPTSLELDPKTGAPKYMSDPNYGITNPLYREALAYQKSMQAPEEWNQASGYYNTAAQGLQGLANYQAQNVSAQQAVAQNAAAQQASAAQMGNIADVSAERASAQQATAAQMGSIADVKAERAAAERAAASRMGNIADVNAQQVDLGKYNIDASKMGKAKDVEAQKLERYQMGDVAPVTTQDLTAYQMEGPGSWTDAGVSSKYMSPYMQGVIDISKREAERDYLKQMNALNAKAMSAGAFGGSRQALERSEAQRNYNQQLQDIQVKGLQQAYESGRSQYGQELSLSQQAALQNLQSKLSTQSQSSQQALQAMLSNQSIDYQTKLQNLQAMLGVQSQEAQQMLNASLANQQSENLFNQTNAQLAQQAALANQGVNTQGALANQQAALQAALANQQTQFGVGSLNANLEQQAALQNAQLGTQTNLANQQAALNAALANQQTQFGVGSLNANLANQVGLQNASLGTQANLANQQAALQAALANQQTQFGVGSLNANLANQVNLQNANLGTQAAMQNAQLGTQTSWQNAANALQASIANQQAGLQANQQNIAAYGAMGNMAGGLGAIGNNQATWQQQQFTNLGAMGNTWGTTAKDATYQNMINQYNMTNPANPIMPVVNAVGNVTGGSTTTGTTSNVPV